MRSPFFINSHILCTSNSAVIEQADQQSHRLQVNDPSSKIDPSLIKSDDNMKIHSSKYVSINASYSDDTDDRKYVNGTKYCVDDFIKAVTQTSTLALNDDGIVITNEMIINEEDDRTDCSENSKCFHSKW